MSKSWWFCLYFILSAGVLVFSFVLKIPFFGGGIWAACGLAVLFVILYLYLKPVTEAVGFLVELFQLPGRSGKNPYLFSLAHHRNRYLRKIWPGLSFYLSSVKTPVSPPAQKRETPDFQSIVDRVVERGRRFYPSLQIEGEVLSRMKVEVFSESLFQCLWELVKNAAQAGAASVVLRGFKNKEWFCIEVKDTGPGISPGVLKQARNIYFSTKAGAAGFGLNVVDQVLSRMGGVMQIQSPEDQGVSVTLFIPLDYMDYARNLGFDSQGLAPDPRLHGDDNASYREDNASYGEDNASYREDNASYREDNASYREDNASYREDNVSYREDKVSYGDEGVLHGDSSRAYKEKSFPRKRESTSHFKVNGASALLRRGDEASSEGGGL